MDDATRGAASTHVARRRYLTFLFSDLSDSTTLAGSIEPELYLEVIEHLKACAFRALAAHSGTLVDFRGDGFLAMFGYPGPSELDGRHAAEAALELHDAIRRPPPTPSGLHRWGASPSRVTLSTHDSGPLWVATPSTSRTCIDNTAPISPRT